MCANVAPGATSNRLGGGEDNAPFADDSGNSRSLPREGRVVRQRGAAECLRRAKGMARREIVWPSAAAVEHRAAGEYT